MITRKTYRVSTREADSRRRLAAGAAHDIDLRALHVELRTGVVAGTVQGNHLGAEKVLAGGDARGDGDGVLALAVDDLLGTPDAVVEAVLLDLEPAVADARVGRGIADLLQVGDARALVGAVHNVVGRRARRAEHVPPDGVDGRACLHRDDLGGRCGRVGGAVARQRVGGDILDGAIVRGDADALALAVVDAADLERLEDGVGAGSANQRERSEDLHGCVVW